MTTRTILPDGWKPREIALVRWLDSSGLDQHWSAKDDLDDCQPVEVLSVGLLVYEGKFPAIGAERVSGADGHITIALSETPDQFGALLSIPAFAIKDMILLQELVPDDDD